MIKKVTFEIAKSLLHQLDELFPEEKTLSQKIMKAISLSLNIWQDHFSSEQNCKPYYASMILPESQNMDTKPVTVRMELLLLRCITTRKSNKKTGSLITGKDLRDSIIVCIAEGVCIKQNNNNYFHKQSPLSVMGNKGNKKMLDVFHQIMQSFANICPDWRIVEPCAGSCTLTLNIDYAYKQYCLNDDDWEKANFFYVLRDHFNDLLDTLYGWTKDRETYDTLKAEEQAFRSANLTPNVIHPDTPAEELDVIRAAARYFYINALSMRNNSTFNDALSDDSYLRKIAALCLLHEKLKDIKLYNEDIFDFLKHFVNKTNTLFIIDPPYLFSSGYSSRLTAGKKEFGFDEHIQLAKMLKGTVRRGNHIIYFCRTTMRPDAGIKDPDEREKDKKCNQKYLTNLICTLYRGVDLYFIDVDIDCNVTERIITSFSFPGSKPLDTDGMCLDKVDLPFPGKGAV